jgi:cell shape-determining protein MreC
MIKTYQTEEQLTSELARLRQKVAGLEALATEQKRLEEALQESQEVLRKIFGSVTDADQPRGDQHHQLPRRR